MCLTWQLLQQYQSELKIFRLQTSTKSKQVVVFGGFLKKKGKNNDFLLFELFGIDEMHEVNYSLSR